MSLQYLAKTNLKNSNICNKINKNYNTFHKKKKNEQKPKPPKPNNLINILKNKCKTRTNLLTEVETVLC